jgi:RES domain-containing protein
VASAWRLTKTKYLAAAWDGEGARKTGGRWNSVGTAVVYTSATLSLALVETLVHLSSSVLPAYSAIPIEFDDALVTALRLEDLPSNWSGHPAPAATQAIGDAWVRGAESAILSVPSVPVPVEVNYVLNPKHRDFRRVQIGKPVRFPFDPRLPLP